MYINQSHLRKNGKFFFRGHTKFLWAYTPLFMDKFPKRPLRLVIVEFGLKSFADLSKNDYWSLKINLFWEGGGETQMWGLRPIF